MDMLALYLFILLSVPECFCQFCICHAFLFNKKMNFLWNTIQSLDDKKNSQQVEKLKAKDSRHSCFLCIRIQSMHLRKAFFSLFDLQYHWKYFEVEAKVQITKFRTYQLNDMHFMGTSRFNVNCKALTDWNDFF